MVHIFTDNFFNWLVKITLLIVVLFSLYLKNINYLKLYFIISLIYSLERYYTYCYIKKHACSDTDYDHVRYRILLILFSFLLVNIGIDPIKNIKYENVIGSSSETWGAQTGNIISLLFIIIFLMIIFGYNFYAGSKLDSVTNPDDVRSKENNFMIINISTYLVLCLYLYISNISLKMKAYSSSIIAIAWTLQYLWIRNKNQAGENIFEFKGGLYWVCILWGLYMLLELFNKYNKYIL